MAIFFGANGAKLFRSYVVCLIVCLWFVCGSFVCLWFVCGSFVCGLFVVRSCVCL